MHDRHDKRGRDGGAALEPRASDAVPADDAATPFADRSAAEASELTAVLEEVNARLDAVTAAHELVRRIAAEFHGLRLSLGSATTAELVGAVVNGIQIPIDTDTIVKAKFAELEASSEQLKAAMHDVDAALALLFASSQGPASGVDATTGSAPRKEVPGATLPGESFRRREAPQLPAAAQPLPGGAGAGADADANRDVSEADQRRRRAHAGLEFARREGEKSASEIASHFAPLGWTQPASADAVGKG